MPSSSASFKGEELCGVESRQREREISRGIYHIGSGLSSMTEGDCKDPAPELTVGHSESDINSVIW